MEDTDPTREEIALQCFLCVRNFIMGEKCFELFLKKKVKIILWAGRGTRAVLGGRMWLPARSSLGLWAGLEDRFELYFLRQEWGPIGAHIGNQENSSKTGKQSRLSKVFRKTFVGLTVVEFFHSMGDIFPYLTSFIFFLSI